MDNPIVFLDIDGVLNSGVEYTLMIHGHTSTLKFFSHGDYVCKFKLKRLHKFLDEIDAKVIMVSSWFWGNPQTQAHLNENLEMIEFLGLTNRILTVSRYTGGGLGRGNEVLEIVNTLGINSWVVIDDAGSNMYSFDTHVINGHVGLSDNDVEILKQRIKDGKH